MYILSTFFEEIVFPVLSFTLMIMQVEALSVRLIISKPVPLKVKLAVVSVFGVPVTTCAEPALNSVSFL